MVWFRSDCAFATPGGTLSLLDLFGEHRQLLLYQLMDTGRNPFARVAPSLRSLRVGPATDALVEYVDRRNLVRRQCAIEDSKLGDSLAHGLRDGRYAVFDAPTEVDFSRCLAILRNELLNGRVPSGFLTAFGSLATYTFTPPIGGRRLSGCASVTRSSRWMKNACSST